ncbi:MAG: tRNA (adenosine(37)-N6)-threonylcarbamoyltransferase complex transferase subunit TsaD [Pseudomonadota bacterium]
MTVMLGIESSCDDTAAALVRLGDPSEVLSNVVYGQNTLHSAFGGVVPEIAARAHAEKVDFAVSEALQEAGAELSECDAIAVTAGPGLIGGVMAGVMAAKGLSIATGLPLIGVNHLAGHALTPVLTDGFSFPYLMLLVSGGHCQFLIAKGPTDFERLGGTIDDAPGEAFDKVARLLGLPQPGGPAVENCALNGNPGRFDLPRPLLDRADCNLSFSGLKTAVLRARDQTMSAEEGLTRRTQADLCAGFQAAVVDVLKEKTARALDQYLGMGPAKPAIAVAGGVAANGSIRGALMELAKSRSVTFAAPPLSLCTDNAAMIAHAGGLLLAEGIRHDMSLTPRPRWPLDSNAGPMLGSGKKGAKA